MRQEAYVAVLDDVEEVRGEAVGEDVGDEHVEHDERDELLSEGVIACHGAAKGDTKVSQKRGLKGGGAVG